jgi:hypothetical protein
LHISGHAIFASSQDSLHMDRAMFSPGYNLRQAS